LLNDSIKLRGELNDLFRNKDVHYGSLPALKVGRICVDERFERKGIGTEMMRLAYQQAEKIQTKLAILPHGTPPIEKLKKVPMLEWAFHETNRLYPPFWGFPRYTTKKIKP